MDITRFLIAAIAVFVFTFLFEWVFHGGYMMDQYQATAGMWRSAEEMQHFFPIGVGFQLALSALIAFLFTRNYEARGMAEGLRFGLYIGLLLGLLAARSYVWTPIPDMMAVCWFVGGLLQGIGSGLVLSLVYRA